MQTLHTLLTILLWAAFTNANVEKIVFVHTEQFTPHSLSTTIRDALGSPHLEVLTPSNPSIRRNIHAQFPPKPSPGPSEAWFLLEGLEIGSRYEVRVCWGATVSEARWLACEAENHFLMPFSNQLLLTCSYLTPMTYYNHDS